MENEKIARMIEYPNTVSDERQFSYQVEKNADKIVRIYKNGEMAPICWFEVWKDNKIIAEIKESICNIYY